MHPIEIQSFTPGTSGASWRKLLANAVRDPDVLCEILQLPERYREPARQAASLFGLVAPRGYIARMEIGNPADPLLRQVLPLAEEAIAAPGFTSDPVGDGNAQRSAGLLQKYRGRALLITTGACAIHCRYCFRRSYPYAEAPRGLEQWEPALAELAADPSIEEVLLSGGDPLTLTDPWLSRLVGRLEAIPHLKRLRIHTRLPIVIPERVNDELLGWLSATRLQAIVVVHANHANELDDSCCAALGRLVDAGFLTLNQSVLLRGVNDNADALTRLSERLIALRVIPYYLHQLDRVSGAAHFEVPEETGLALVAELRRRLPGYAVPRYVREIEGQPHKTVLA